MNNLLFVENTLSTIVPHLNSDTDYIMFDSSKSYDDLLQEVSGINQYTNIGIFSHGNSDMFTFVDPIFNTENVPFKTFLQQLKEKVSFENLDLFSCFFGNNLGYISSIESDLAINIRASTDETGNEPFGDWIMETDNIDIKNIYFTDSITEFKEILTYIMFSYRRVSNDIINSLYVQNNYALGGYKTGALLKSDGTLETWGEWSDTPTTAGITKLYHYGDEGFVILTDQNEMKLWTNGTSVLSGVTVEKIYTDFLRSNVLIYTITNGEVYRIKDSSITPETNVTSSEIKQIIGHNDTDYVILKQDNTIYDTNNISSTFDNTNIKRIYINGYAYAALKLDGTVISWGDQTRGGNSSTVETQLTDVTRIYAASFAFAALKSDGTVVTWGDGTAGGVVPDTVSEKLTDVTRIYTTDKAFAALKSDGSVVTWGDDTTGGVVPDTVSEKLTSDVTRVYSTYSAFAALKSDGTVVTWGNSINGGDSSDVETQLTGVTRIYSASSGFAALKSDGSVVTWGNISTPGNLDYTNVKSVIGHFQSFGAIKNDGSFIRWGTYTNSPGDSDIVLPTDIQDLTHLSNSNLPISSDIIDPIVTEEYISPSAFIINDDTIDLITSDVVDNVVTVDTTITADIAPLVDAGLDPLSYQWSTSTEIDGVFEDIEGETNPTFKARQEDTGNFVMLTVLVEDNSEVVNSVTLDPILVSAEAVSSGDPYITTFNGVTYKLPNTNRMYRCIDTVIDGKQLIVNCSVGQLTSSERDELREYARTYLLPSQNVLDDGYFYDNFYIKYDDKYIVFNRKTDIIDTNLDSLTNDIIHVTFDNEIKDFHCDIQGRAEYVSTNINIGGIHISLLKILHPQIINGIRIKRTNNNVDIKNGIFVRSINPKEYRIKNLYSTKKIIPSNDKIYNFKRKETWSQLETNTTNVLNV